MSLIQDALKRQQEESASSFVPMKAAAAPSVPDAMPVSPGPEPANRPLPASRPLSAAPPVNPEKPGRPGKSWKLIAGIVVFCILIIWGGGLLVKLVLKQSAGRTLLGQFVLPLTKARVTLGEPSAQASPPAARPPAAAMSKPGLAPSPAPVPASSPLLSPAAAAAPAFADEGEDVADDLALPGVKEQIEPAAVPEPAPWPRLKLSAIYSNIGSGQSLARLNDRLILLGDQIDGVTLVEIRRDSVVLKFGKQARTLKMGMTLN